MMSQTAPSSEEELTVWWERQTSKQIMQYSVTCAGMEVHQSAERRRGLTGVGGGSCLYLCHPLLIPLGGGDPLVFGIPQGCGDRTSVLRGWVGLGGLGSTLFPTRASPSDTMATVVAMETAGGAGKDGTPHRKPPTQRHGPSLELFPERPPLHRWAHLVRGQRGAT